MSREMQIHPGSHLSIKPVLKTRKTAAISNLRAGMPRRENCRHFPRTRVQNCRYSLLTTHVETVVLLSHRAPDSHINVKVEFGEGKGKVPLDKIAERAEKYKPKEKVTYKKIKEYIEEKYGFKVHTAYIAEVKRAFGLPMYDAPNAVEKLKNRKAHPTKDKVRAITDALIHFELISKKEASAVKIAHLSAI